MNIINYLTEKRYPLPELTDESLAAEFSRIRALESYASTTMIETSTNSQDQPSRLGYAEIEVFAPGAASRATAASSLEANPLLPTTNLQPLSSGELGRNVFVFFMGFVVIFAGVMLAKKLKLIGGTLMNKEDRKLIEKAKRALGL